MKDQIITAYAKWKSDIKGAPKYQITEKDKRVATIAAMYSEDELRHAAVMRAALRRVEVEKPTPTIRNDMRPNVA